jgi:phospholipid/cholesterol/gamma-HCH transport system substrate-binding protein
MKITKVPASRTGIFVLVCFSLLIIGLFLIGDKQKLFSNTSNYFVKLREVSGLKKGAIVTISGISVGSVNSIEMPKRSGDSVLVSIHILKDAANLIHTDSKATVTTVGLVGDKIIAVTVGTANAPIVKPEGLITGESPRELMGLVDTVARALDAVKDLAQQANSLFADIRGGKGTMGKLLTDESLYKEIQSIVVNSDRSIVAVTNTARNLETSLDSAVRDFTKTSTEFRKIGNTLNNSKGTIGKLLNDTEFYAKLQNLSQSINSTVAELHDAMTKISTASGNTAEITEALKHNFLVKDYFEDRGYWSASDQEKKIQDRIDTLKKIESDINYKLKSLQKPQ